MKTSNYGLDIIREHEGLKLETYLDPVGVPTIGYGHTGSAAFMGNKITKQKADKLLKSDVEEAERGVLSSVDVELKQNQFDALVSWVFNLGIGNLRSSTLLKYINARESADEISKQFERWVYGTINGQKEKLPGLINRRSDEAELWASENYFKFKTEVKKKMGNNSANCCCPSCGCELVVEIKAVGC